MRETSMLARNALTVAILVLAALLYFLTQGGFMH
jgi:hypothetical protein